MNSKKLALASLFVTLMIVSSASAADVQLDMQQAAVQKFLTTLGSVGVSGVDQTSISFPYPGICWWGPFPYPCIKWGSCIAQYSWSLSLSNLSAQITPGGIPFTGNGNAQASASICGIGPSLSYSPDINGLLSATWQVGPQEIWIAMQTLNIEIYVRILGIKITLGSVNVASLLPNPLFKQKLQFAQQFTLPNPISKQITVSVQNPNLTLFSGYLRFTANLNFTSP